MFDPHGKKVLQVQGEIMVFDLPTMRERDDLRMQIDLRRKTDREEADKRERQRGSDLVK